METPKLTAGALIKIRELSRTIDSVPFWCRCLKEYSEFGGITTYKRETIGSRCLIALLEKIIGKDKYTLSHVYCVVNIIFNGFYNVYYSLDAGNDPLLIPSIGIINRLTGVNHDEIEVLIGCARSIASVYKTLGTLPIILIMEAESIDMTKMDSYDFNTIAKSASNGIRIPDSHIRILMMIFARLSRCPEIPQITSTVTLKEHLTRPELVYIQTAIHTIM